MPLSKFSGVALNSVSKIDGVSVNGISEINAVELTSAITNTKSLSTDGSNYLDITLASDIIPHNAGSISCWVKVEGVSQTPRLSFSTASMMRLPQVVVESNCSTSTPAAATCLLSTERSEMR